MMNDNTLVTYVINLKRSTERMENMDRALKAMQVDYERVEGVDAQRLSEDLLSRNATPSAERRVSVRIDEGRACLLLQSSQVLEDACKFSA